MRVRQAETTVWFLRWEEGSRGARQEAWSILSGDERARAERFAFEGDRERWIWWRAGTRRILGEALGRAAEAIRFSVGEKGKPYLEDGEGLHFNVSHTRDAAAVAVSRAGPVGVDVEMVRRDYPALEVADRYFTPTECAALRASADAQALFFRLWTAKEAVMKATGLGMHLEPQQIEIELEEGNRPGHYRLLDEGAAAAKGTGPFRLHFLEHSADGFACLAAPASEGRVLWMGADGVELASTGA